MNSVGQICMGLDPGWAFGGVAVVGREGSRLVLLHHERIATKPSQSDDEREELIWQCLSAPMRAYHPRALGIERQSGAAVGARTFDKRAAAAAARGQTIRGARGFNAANDNVNGVVWYAKGCARAFGVRRVMVTPQQAKIAVLGKGGGSAKKDQVIEAVRRLFPELGTDKLSEHEADAIAIAIFAGRAIALPGAA